MGYHRYICLHNPQTVKEAAARVTNIFNNAYVKTSSTQQPDRFASLLHLAGTCTRATDLYKVQSVLGLSKVCFTSELCLPSLGTSVTLCDLMQRHMSHVELTKLELNFEKQVPCPAGLNMAASSFKVSLSLAHHRFRPGEPLRLQLRVKTLSGIGSGHDTGLLAYVQDSFQALHVPFTIGSLSEVRSRRALVPLGSSYAPCTRITGQGEEGFDHLRPVEAVVFSDEDDRRQALVELSWSEQGAGEALFFLKRAVAVWLGRCDQAKYLLDGDYDFMVDLLKPLDSGAPPSLKQLTAKLVLDKTPPSLPAVSSLGPQTPRSEFLDGIIPRELVEYMKLREEVVLLGSLMRYSFECSEQQAKDKKLPSHVVLPFLEYCASMTLRPHPRTLSCDYLDLSKKEDGTIEIAARAYKAAISNAENFYGEALRAE